MDKVKKFINENQFEACIILVSFVALIAGILAIGFFKAFCIIGIADAVILVPGFLNKTKGKPKKKKKPQTKMVHRKRKQLVQDLLKTKRKRHLRKK